MGKPITDGMADMKMNAEDRREYMQPYSSDKQEYPYGLCLRLENAELEKLGIKSLPEPGETFVIQAVGKVSSSHESKCEGEHKDRAVQIQITHLTLTRKHGAA